MITAFVRHSYAVAILAVGFAACAPVSAQSDPGSPELAAKQKNVLEQMQVVRAWKLAEALDLDDSNGPKLLATLAEYDTKLFAAHRDLRQAERALRRAFKGGEVSDDEMERMLEDAIQKKKALDAIRYEQLEAAGKTLDVRRRVKLYNFMPKFEREIRQRFREGRRGKRHGRDGKTGQGPGGPGQPPGKKGR